MKGPSEYELTCRANIRAWEECLEFVEWLENGPPPFERAVCPKGMTPAVARSLGLIDTK